jgi:preprotein translocase subunit YajC
MSQNNTLFRGSNISPFIPGSLLLICSALLVVAASYPRTSKAKLTKKSASSVQTQSSVVVAGGLKLEILGIKQHPNDIVEVTMKNGYEREVTAIVASAGNSQSFRRDYAYAEAEVDQKLAPGASDMFLYSPTRRSGVLPKIVVSAVVFADGTSKGDRSEVMEVLEKRVGMKIQLNRINPHLESLSNVKGSLIRSKLEALKRIAEALPIDKGNGSPMSSGVESGLRHGRAFILKYLSNLETALKNERIEIFYQNGAPQTVRHSPEEEFRNILPRIQKDFKGLADRL